MILYVPTGQALTSQEMFVRAVTGQSFSANQFLLHLASFLGNPANSGYTYPGATGNLKIESAATQNDGSTVIHYTFSLANGTGGTITGSGVGVIR